MAQRELFDRGMSDAARDKAIDDAERGARVWVMHAMRVIGSFSVGTEFTTDDLWRCIDHPPPDERRAMGPVMMYAARRGLVESTGRYRKSSRVICHSSPKQIWKRKSAL